MFPILDLPSFQLCFRTDLKCYCNCKSEISNVFNVMEGRCLQAMKIVHHCASSCSDWLISGQQSVNRCREAMSEKYKKFTFVHPVGQVEFIKFILLLFCFAQRLSFSCDTQKWESVVTWL